VSIAAVALGVLLATCVALPGSNASAGTTAGVPWTATFLDPAGDVSGAPDVTKVAITGYETGEIFNVSVTVTGHEPATPDGLSRWVFVWLDIDKNESTGSAGSGCEYVLVSYDDPA